MDDTRTITGRERAIVAAIAALVMLLALLRPTPELRDQGDGVNVVPVGASPLSDLADAP